MIHSPLRHAPLRGSQLTVLAIVWVAGLLSACVSSPHSAQPETPEPGIAAALALVGPDWPMDAQRRVTTSGDIYLANLESQILALSLRVQRRADDPSLARLALLRYHRFQVLGTLPDAVAARELLEAAQARPHDAAIDLAAAQVLLGFHAFEPARQAVRCATRDGAAADAIGARQAAIDAATGMADDRKAGAYTAAVDTTGATGRVLAAADRVDRGDPAAASRLLKQAQDDYVDTAPYELSWIHVQQGIVFLRHGELEAARTFFAAAHERFPQYALAAEHLAETELALGRPEAARQLYLDVARQSGQPEFWYRLSRAERQLGQTAAAEAHLRDAERGYEALLKAHPAMFADHAARYFIDEDEVARAHELALANYRQRRNLGATSLLIGTAVETGNDALACRLLNEVRAQGYAPPELSALLRVQHGNCGRTTPAAAMSAPL